jgi:hypothetical protein
VSGGEKLHLWSPEGKLLDTCDREEVEGTMLNRKISEIMLCNDIAKLNPSDKNIFLTIRLLNYVNLCQYLRL